MIVLAFYSSLQQVQYFISQYKYLSTIFCSNIFLLKFIPDQNIFYQALLWLIERRNSKGRLGTLLTHFTKNFCCFLTPKVKSGTDMINPSIESSDFLFWHEKIWS